MAHNGSVQKLLNDLVERHEASRDRLIKKVMKRAPNRSEVAPVANRKGGDANEDNPRAERQVRKRLSLVDTDRRSGGS